MQMHFQDVLCAVVASSRIGMKWCVTGFRLRSFLTRVKIDVSVLAAVAASYGGHQCCRVGAAAVKFNCTGGVIGRTGSDMAMGSCHLNGVEFCSSTHSPGELCHVCSTVHTSSEVGGLTRD